jgi:hypothetical protein
VALAGGSAMAAFITAAVLWVLTRADVITFASAAAGDQVRNVVTSGGREVIGTLFGEQVFAAMAQTGLTGLVVTATGFLVAATLGLVGLRARAAASRSRS